MSDTFNGYHVWLGIPLHEQPPNHYRLLGIAAFETDVDVIDHAADRQMAHVRTFQSGRHAALSQQILNELSAARVCLLSPPKKAEYDEQLRSKMPSAAPIAAVPIAQAVPIAKPLPATPKAPVVGKPAARVSKPQIRDDADDLTVELDLPERSKSISDFGGAPAFNLSGSRRRRRLSGAPTWREPLGLALIAAGAVIAMVVLYHLVRLVLSLNWKEYFPPPAEEPPASSAPLEPHTKSAPPAPEPESTTPDSEPTAPAAEGA